MQPSSAPLQDSTASLLCELYKSRWEQIRHLNDLDQRSIVMVGSAIGAIIVAFPQLLTIPRFLSGALSIVAAMICYGAVYSTIRNRTQLELCLATIDRVESLINRNLFPGLFPIAGNYRAPAVRRDFIRRVMRSIRGPIILIFVLSFAGSVFNVLDLIQWFPRWMSMTLAFLASIAVLWWCFYKNFGSEQGNYRDINDTESKQTQTASAANPGAPPDGRRRR